MRKKEKSEFPALILFLCGFLLGNLIPNIFWKMEWGRKTMSALYLLNAFAAADVPGTAYLKEILYMRGSMFVLCAVCGFSIFGAPVAIAGTILTGMGTGAVLSMSVLEFGFAGGLAGLALLLPQYLLYVPSILLLLSGSWKLSLRVWKNRGILPERMENYGITIFLGGLGMAAGILLECYVNPVIVEKIMDILKIF